MKEKILILKQRNGKFVDQDFLPSPSYKYRETRYSDLLKGCRYGRLEEIIGSDFFQFGQQQVVQCLLMDG